MTFVFVRGKLTATKALNDKIRQGHSLQKLNPGQSKSRLRTGWVYNFQREDYDIPRQRILAIHKQEFNDEDMKRRIQNFAGNLSPLMHLE